MRTSACLFDLSFILTGLLADRSRTTGPLFNSALRRQERGSASGETEMNAVFLELRLRY